MKIVKIKWKLWKCNKLWKYNENCENIMKIGKNIMKIVKIWWKMWKYYENCENMMKIVKI